MAQRADAGSGTFRVGDGYDDVNLDASVQVKQRVRELVRMNRTDLLAALKAAWESRHTDRQWDISYNPSSGEWVSGDELDIPIVGYKDSHGFEPLKAHHPPVPVAGLTVHKRSIDEFRHAQPGHAFTGLVSIPLGKVYLFPVHDPNYQYKVKLYSDAPAPIHQATYKINTTSLVLEEAIMGVLRAMSEEEYMSAGRLERRLQDALGEKFDRGLFMTILGAAHRHEPARPGPIVHGDPASHVQIRDMITDSPKAKWQGDASNQFVAFTIIKGGGGLPHRYSFKSNSTNQKTFRPETKEEYCRNHRIPSHRYSPSIHNLGSGMPPEIWAVAIHRATKDL